MTDSRRYEHDCDDCKYLGQFQLYDAYFCPHGKELIARNSSVGPDYVSGPSLPYTINPETRGAAVLPVVAAMAKAAGYLPAEKDTGEKNER